MLRSFSAGFLLYLQAINCYAQNDVPLTRVTFSTSDQRLQALYDRAELLESRNIKKTENYQFLIEGGRYRHVWLETQPMGGYMYAKRNLATARSNIRVFLDFQREDGRFPGMIRLYNDPDPTYGWLQGYCFPMPAFELYYWFGKEKRYLEKLYTALEKFDNYLWKTRDSDKDGCLESWCVYDTGEDNNVRYAGMFNEWPAEKAPPKTIESMDVMSYSYTGRDVLALISKELANGKAGYWREKAEEVRKKIKEYLWDASKKACYDRDYRNKAMNILLHNNIRCMYYGSFDQQMADEFIAAHLLNPAEFWTPMPLPSIAANDPMFRNAPGNNWSGQPQGLTFQRSISALENYGHYAELTLLGTKFLSVIKDQLLFPQQFDPFSAKVNPGSDGYGPSILSALEFVSRMFGVHLGRETVYWSCIASGEQYSYTQQRGKYNYKLATLGNRVSCLVNGRERFSFTKGVRVLSDEKGGITGLAGIGTVPISCTIISGTKKWIVQVKPNTVYRLSAGKFSVLRSVPFKM